MIHNRHLLKTSHHMSKNIWLLKPTGMNRGRGIYVFNTLDRLKTLIRELTEGIVVSDPIS
jgi:hypothetical protein